MNHLGAALLLLLNDIRQTLASMPQIWQHGLLTAAQLRTFASERGIQVLNEETLLGLWRAGLLRADLVTSDAQLSVPGLVSAGKVQDTKGPLRNNLLVLIFHCNERGGVWRGTCRMLRLVSLCELDYE